MPLSKEYLERLIEASPDIVVATDAKGMVAFYNDGARETLGYSREEIIGRFVAQLYPGLPEAKRVMAAMRDAAQGGRGRVVNFPTEFVSKTGTNIPVAISGVILYGEGGREHGTIGFAKDLREILRKDQLATLGEIAIGLSHEINNPLEVITNQLELLERFVRAAGDAPQARDAARCIDGIRGEVARIERNVRRLSDMADLQQYASTEYFGGARMIDLQTPRRPELGPLAGGAILVVDDDPAVRESVAALLRADGASVETALDGEVALTRLEARRFDAVLSDVVMPGMDGYELLREVRLRHPGTSVVLMTAFYYDKDHVIKRSRMEGLEGVLFKKPVDPERLRKTLAEAISQRTRGPSAR